MYRKLISILVAAIISATATASPDSGLKYTKDNPLVYEDLWDLPPFSFINEEGQPDGFNIALVKEMMKRLNVPYVIKLKHTPLNFQDVQSGEAALTIGMKAHYHERYAAFGKNTLMLFTHSVASPKNAPTEIHNFEDLKNNKVYVHRNSFSHNQMIDAGYSDNAIPADDLKAILMQVAANDSGMVLWNTNTLKDLIERNHIDNLKLTTVSMKYGEYHFMSRDSLLLHKLDSVYDEMVAHDEILPLQKAWFYPEIKNNYSYKFAWYLASALGLFFLILIAYNIYYKVQERRFSETNARQSKRLGLLLRSGKIDVWTYNITNKLFTLINKEEKSNDEYNLKTFALLFPDDDFKRIIEEIENIEAGLYDTTKLLVRCNLSRDTEVKQMTYFDLSISVLQSGDDDLPISLIGIMHDVTAEKKRFIDTRNNLLKYRTIFNTSMADLAYYDKDGILTDINHNACMTFGIDDPETLIKSKTHISEIPVFMGLKGDVCREMWMSSITDMDKLHMEKDSTKYWTRTGMIYYEFTIIPIYDSDGTPICFVSCGKDVTDTAKRMNKERMRQRRIENTNDQIKNYTNDINYALEVSGTRLANYYPDTHEMTIAYDIKKPMLRLSQLRCVSLLDREYKLKAEKLFLNLDKKRLKRFDLRVGTIFKEQRKEHAHYEFNGIPIKKDGEIDHYFCLCRNISQLVETEKQLEEETKRAQEAEAFQNSFLKNMSHEIRTPLYTVVGFAELFQGEHDKSDEPVFIDQIKQNSDMLLKLVNNILLLSRIDAKMVEINPTPIDFPEFFKAKCMMGWTQGVQPGVETKIETNEDHLMVEIDDNHVGLIIETLCRISCLSTDKGSIHARYLYHSGMMTLIFKDTGQSMSDEQKECVRNRNMNEESGNYSIMIQLIICQQLAALMGGQMEFDSEQGKGNTFCISFPCKILEMPKQKEPAVVSNNDLLANADMLSEEDINNLLANSDLFK